MLNQGRTTAAQIMQDRAEEKASRRSPATHPSPGNVWCAQRDETVAMRRRLDAPYAFGTSQVISLVKPYPDA